MKKQSTPVPGGMILLFLRFRERLYLDDRERQAVSAMNFRNGMLLVNVFLSKRMVFLLSGEMGDGVIVFQATAFLGAAWEGFCCV